MTDFLDPAQPLTVREQDLFHIYRRHTKFHGFEVFCGDCGVRETCCRDEPEPRATRSWWRRL